MTRILLWLVAALLLAGFILLVLDLAHRSGVVTTEAEQAPEVVLTVPGPSLPPTTTTTAPSTTTTARARTAPTMRVASVSPAEVLVNTCGGDLPPCSVLRRESGGDPRIWNGRCYAPVGWQGATAPNCPRARSSASGLWQFVRGTWANHGGYLNAADAPVEVQNEKARLVWAGGAGCFHWNAC